MSSSIAGSCIALASAPGIEAQQVLGDRDAPGSGPVLRRGRGDCVAGGQLGESQHQPGDRPGWKGRSAWLIGHSGLSTQSQFFRQESRYLGIEIRVDL